MAKLSSIAADPSGDGPRSMKDLMADLSAGQRKVVQAVTAEFQRELIEALPEVEAGVRTSGAQGSFSATLDVKHAKKGRFRGTLKCRVRRPREPAEFDFHVDDTGQLSLGLPDGWSDNDPD